MSEQCGHQAVIITTRDVDGTTTNVLVGRTELTCRHEAGHSGPHADPEAGEEWEGPPGRRTTIPRQDEPKG